MPSMVNGKLLSHRESCTIRKLGFACTARIENKRFGGRSIYTITVRGKKVVKFHRMQLETQVSIPDEIFMWE